MGWRLVSRCLRRTVSIMSKHRYRDFVVLLAMTVLYVSVMAAVVAHRTGYIGAVCDPADPLADAAVCQP